MLLDTDDVNQLKLARFLLLSLKEAELEINKKTWYGGHKMAYINYISKVIDLPELTLQGITWGEHSKSIKKPNKPNSNLLSAYIQEAEKHLDMCSDEQIRLLTGQRKLWECAKESAFAEVESFEEGSIETTIAPNPSNGNFKISLKLEKETTVHIELMTLDGKTISKNILQSDHSDIAHYYFQQRVELEGLQSGMYLLTIRQGNKMITEKVIVQ